MDVKGTYTYGYYKGYVGKGVQGADKDGYKYYADENDYKEDLSEMEGE